MSTSATSIRKRRVEANSLVVSRKWNLLVGSFGVGSFGVSVMKDLLLCVHLHTNHADKEKAEEWSHTFSTSSVVDFFGLPLVFFASAVVEASTEASSLPLLFFAAAFVEGFKEGSVVSFLWLPLFIFAGTRESSAVSAIPIWSSKS
ncbi:hypothetical protein Tco_1156602 [Tanacetum coccineum]